MPMINADDGCPIHVEVTGADSAPALMLSNSLGTDLHMWDDQVGEWSKHFRVIRYDRRGHGQSGASRWPLFSFERFGRDVSRILDALKVKRRNWCGLSMGGMDGQWLGANAPDRVEKLVLANTNYLLRRPEPRGPTASAPCTRRALPLSSTPIWSAGSPRAFIARAPQAIERMKEMFLATNPDGYVGCVARRQPDRLPRLEPAHQRADACHRR